MYVLFNSCRLIKSTKSSLVMKTTTLKTTYNVNSTGITRMDPRAFIIPTTSFILYNILATCITSSKYMKNKQSFFFLFYVAQDNQKERFFPLLWLGWRDLSIIKIEDTAWMIQPANKMQCSR